MLRSSGAGTVYEYPILDTPGAGWQGLTAAIRQRCDIGGLYERQEVREHLVRDGKRLIAWIDAQLSSLPQAQEIAQWSRPCSP